MYAYPGYNGVFPGPSTQRQDRDLILTLPCSLSGWKAIDPPLWGSWSSFYTTRGYHNNLRVVLPTLSWIRTSIISFSPVHAHAWSPLHFSRESLVLGVPEEAFCSCPTISPAGKSRCRSSREPLVPGVRHVPRTCGENYAARRRREL